MFKTIMDNIIMMMPLIVLQLGLMIFCIIKILKEDVQNLNKTIWILIVAFVNIVGPILFLLIGRKKDEYEERK